MQKCALLHTCGWTIHGDVCVKLVFAAETTARLMVQGGSRRFKGTNKLIYTVLTEHVYDLKVSSVQIWTRVFVFVFL